jgi:hypothetical protein
LPLNISTQPSSAKTKEETANSEVNRIVYILFIVGF